MEWVKMTFKDGFELSLAYHEGVLNLLMFGEHERKVFTSTGHHQGVQPGPQGELQTILTRCIVCTILTAASLSPNKSVRM